MAPASARIRTVLRVSSTVAAVGLLAALARRWLDVVEVRGTSMAPTYRPGDRLLVERWTWRRRAPRPGDVVLAPDPREAGRELLKRVSAVADGRVALRGDSLQASTDSRMFGPVPDASIRWRVALRYWPPRRA